MTIWEYSYISIYTVRKKLKCASSDEAFMSLLVYAMLDCIGWLTINLFVFYCLLPKLKLAEYSDYTGVSYISGLVFFFILDYFLLYRRFPVLYVSYTKISHKTRLDICSVAYYLIFLASFVLILLYMA